MTNNYVFSATDNSFYPTELREMYEHAGTWPHDARPVDDTSFAEFSGFAPEGKSRGAGDDGFPCWVDILPPVVDELIVTASVEK
ncbi:Uncharacterised protein [Leminorella richardii]|uniref:Uncharacterized protein n=1 Tax=Leminorella richardii TaxID=158841 RepID=A0A2X4UV66_9GAMM|nr:tail fiber assembly protein [Leminorella richardii]SQI42309.1 Uncharacterised protein [Leminorella richardii]